MNRLCFSALNKLRYLTVTCSKSTPTFHSQFKFQAVKLYSVSTVAGDDLNPSPSDIAEETHQEDNNSNSNNDSDTSIKATNETQNVKPSITERLLRLSEQSPEEYVPTLDYEAAEAQRWERYSKGHFPDQSKRNLHPNQRPSAGNFRSNYGSGFSFGTPNRSEGGYSPNRYEGDGGGGGYSQNRYQGGYSQSRYEGGYRNNRYDNNSAPNRYRSIRNEDLDDDDESVNYRPPNRYESRSSSQRRQNRFDDEDEGEDFDDESHDSSPRYPANTRRYNGKFDGGYSNRSFGHKEPQRRSHRDDSLDFDEEPRQKIDYKKMQQDFDLDDSDLPEEPRQSSNIRFANSENRQAIKDAYLKRFQGVDSTGSKREFHSYAPRVSPKSFAPDFKNVSKLEVVNSSGDKLGNKFNSKRPSKKRSDTEESNKGNIESGLPTEFFERDVLLTGNDDPDIFGSLASRPNSNSSRLDFQVEDASPQDSKDNFAQNFDTIYEEEEEGDQVFRPPVRMTMETLTSQTKELFAVGKVTEALDLFTNTMKEGGFRYDLHELEYLYRIIICEVAKEGHVKMAFKLYTQMVKRGLRIVPGVYTSVFNACANSPWAAEDNLRRLNRLRDYMDRKGILPNLVNYNAMIKAFGRNGDLETAFALVDEMLERRERDLRPDAVTFCFLMQACLSDKENGFRHALLTWEKMRSMRIRTKIYNYNLLLRTARECSVALPDDVKKQLEKRNEKLLSIKCNIWDVDELKQYSPENASLIDSEFLVSEAADSKHVQTLNSLESILPNTLLSSISSGHHDGKVVLSVNELDALRRLSDKDFRLKMLGGMEGILDQMKRDRISPDLKTMKEFLILVEPKEVLTVMKMTELLKIKPNVGFYNIIIRKLCITGRGHESREILKVMAANRVSPDAYTWTALAMGCHKWLDAKALMADMADSHFTPTVDLLGSFLSVACKRCDPLYVIHLLNEMKAQELTPSAQFLDHLQQFRKNVRRGIVQAETGKLVTVPHLRVHLKNDPELFRQNWKKFQLNYDAWVKKAEVNIDPTDPWEEDYLSRSKFAKKTNEQSDDL